MIHEKKYPKEDQSSLNPFPGVKKTLNSHPSALPGVHPAQNNYFCTEK
jgi:hypothetical protein